MAHLKQEKMYNRNWKVVERSFKSETRIIHTLYMDTVIKKSIKQKRRK